MPLWCTMREQTLPHYFTVILAGWLGIIRNEEPIQGGHRLAYNMHGRFKHVMGPWADHHRCVLIFRFKYWNFPIYAPIFRTYYIWIIYIYICIMFTSISYFYFFTSIMFYYVDRLQLMLIGKDTARELSCVSAWWATVGLWLVSLLWWNRPWLGLLFRLDFKGKTTAFVPMTAGSSRGRQRGLLNLASLVCPVVSLRASEDHTTSHSGAIFLRGYRWRWRMCLVPTTPIATDDSHNAGDWSWNCLRAMLSPVIIPPGQARRAVGGHRATSGLSASVR